MGMGKRILHRGDARKDKSKKVAESAEKTSGGAYSHRKMSLNGDKRRKGSESPF